MEDAPSFVERRQLPGGRVARGSQDQGQTRSKVWIPFTAKNDGKESHAPSENTWNPVDGATVSTSSVGKAASGIGVLDERAAGEYALA